MGIRIEHQPSGAAVGAAAYAAGKNKAKQRKQKYATDLWRDDQRTRARRQEQAMGMQFRKHLFNEQQEAIGARAQEHREFIEDQATARRNQELADMAQERKWDAGDAGQRMQHDEDMLTDRGLQTGDLVVSKAAQAEIDKIDAGLVAYLAKGDLNAEQKAEAREKAEEKKRALRRQGAEKPPEVEELDALNRSMVYVNPETGDWERPGPGKPGTHQMIDKVPTPIQQSTEQQEAKTVAEAAQKRQQAKIDSLNKRADSMRDKATDARTAEEPNEAAAKTYERAEARLRKEAEGLEGQAPGAGGEEGPPKEHLDPATGEVTSPPSAEQAPRTEEGLQLPVSVPVNAQPDLPDVPFAPDFMPGPPAAAEPAKPPMADLRQAAEELVQRIKPTARQARQKASKPTQKEIVAQRRADERARRQTAREKVTARKQAKQGKFSVSGPETTLSPDGKWEWNGTKWVPAGGA